MALNSSRGLADISDGESFLFIVNSESSIEPRDSSGFKLIKQGHSVRGTPALFVSSRTRFLLWAGSLET